MSLRVPKEQWETYTRLAQQQGYALGSWDAWKENLPIGMRVSQRLSRLKTAYDLGVNLLLSEI